MTTMKPVQIHIPVTQATALSIAARAANLTLEEMASAFVAETFIELTKSIKASQRSTPAIPMPTPTMMLAAIQPPAPVPAAPEGSEAAPVVVDDEFSLFHAS